jgi:hypothetical protein
MRGVGGMSRGWREVGRMSGTVARDVMLAWLVVGLVGVVVTWLREWWGGRDDRNG